MENSNINRKRTSNGAWGGVVIVLIGIGLLLGNLDINLPHWLFSWSTFLMAFGLIIGAKHNFKGAGWLVMVFVGAMFTLDDIVDFNVSMGKLIWPIVLIGVGAFLILRPKRRNKLFDRANSESPSGFDQPLEMNNKANQDDFIDSVNVFGGSHQKVFSKNFQGGDIVAIFGGCDVDLSQAEFQSTVVIDITAVFGGCKIIVPPSWEVKSEISAIFGGVDDKRNIMPLAEGNNKRIVLKGLAMFGGVDIRNY